MTCLLALLFTHTIISNTAVTPVAPVLSLVQYSTMIQLQDQEHLVDLWYGGGCNFAQTLLSIPSELYTTPHCLNTVTLKKWCILEIMIYNNFCTDNDIDTLSYCLR